MPHKLRIDALQAELAELRNLKTEAQEMGDIVGESQCSERIEEVETEIERLNSAETPFANVALYFSGRPVFGSRGIAAEFAGKALEHYQEMVSRWYAKQELGVLGERGRIPMRASTNLMVTGLTHGSFGFVLEELSKQDELHETALKEVVSDVSHLLFTASAENDSEFERILEDLDSRTLVVMRDFFKELDSKEATIRVVEDKTEFSLDSMAIGRGRMRTEATEIEEKSEPISGVLLGLLPEHRRFELRVHDGETLYGTVTKDAAAQFDEAVQEGRVSAQTYCEAECLVREVRPLNREARLTYRITRFNRIGGDE